MHNSEQVRDFFRKMADGLVLNHAVQEEDRYRPEERRNQDKPAVERAGNVADFGVGLPPLAHS